MYETAISFNCVSCYNRNKKPKMLHYVMFLKIKIAKFIQNLTLNLIKTFEKYEEFHLVTEELSALCEYYITKV